MQTTPSSTTIFNFTTTCPTYEHPYEHGPLIAKLMRGTRYSDPPTSSEVTRIISTTSTRKNIRSWSHGGIRQGKSRHMIGEIIWVMDGRKSLCFSLGPAESSRYQRAYVDFFEDQLVLNGYDWRRVLGEYLFTGKEPLINCMIAGRRWSFLILVLLKCLQTHSWPPSHPPRLRLRTLFTRLGHGSTRLGDNVLQFPAQIPR